MTGDRWFDGDYSDSLASPLARSRGDRGDSVGAGGSGEHMSALVFSDPAKDTKNCALELPVEHREGI